MSDATTEQAAEPKNKTAGLSVTAAEYRDINFVAAFREISQSDLLRQFTDLDAIRAEAARIRELKDVA